MTLSGRLEALKIWFTLTTRSWAVKWISLCDEWLESRKSEKAIEWAGFIPLKKFRRDDD